MYKETRGCQIWGPRSGCVGWTTGKGPPLRSEKTPDPDGVGTTGSRSVCRSCGGESCKRLSYGVLRLVCTSVLHETS